MPRHSFKAALALLALLTALVMTTLPASAHTHAVPARAENPRLGCHSLSVHLHGMAPATSTCLDGKPGPSISHEACDQNSLVIYADAGFSGWTICFFGAGSTDMTSYGFGLFRTWNDQASSYVSGINAGAFYADTGQRGQRQSFGTHEMHNFDGTGSYLPNDSLSSVCIQADSQHPCA